MNSSPTGRYLVTATEDQLLVWEIDPDSWPDIACAAAGRSLTAAEWAEFMGELPYDPICV